MITVQLFSSQTNRELEGMSKAENIVKWIKNLHSRTGRGRPRKIWKEEVERDLQVLGVRRWTKFVADTKKWKDVVRQAKAHSGL